MGKVRIIEQGYLPEEREKEINEDVKKMIRQYYELEDEIKLLRRAVHMLAKALNVDLPLEFEAYNTIVEDAVETGKKKKKQIKAKTIKVREKEGKIT